jgi:ribosomal-protein-alanine N-acetyltransferase
MDALSLIRPARRADVPALAALERRCFSDPWTAEALGELIGSPSGLLLVVEEVDGIEAYLVARAVAGEGEILSLAVAPECRRRGLGARLLIAGLEAMAAGGAFEVYLEVRVSNAAALALYGRHGFAPIGRRPRYYRNPVEDALVLRRALPAVRRSGTDALDSG